MLSPAPSPSPSGAADIDALFSAINAGQPTHAELLADGRCSVAAAHPDLNRYSDCWPLDSHLVDTGPADYLNASLVQNLAAAPAYIMAAGPMAPGWHGPDTRHAFWSAVWHHGVRVIVALAVPAAGFQGCAPYAGGTHVGRKTSRRHRNPAISVEVLNESNPLGSGLAIERKLLLTRGDETRECTQIEFGAWPNYGVASSSSVASLIERVDLLRHGSARDADAEPPLLVHCAGGVGRTGAFVTAHSLHCEERQSGVAPTAAAVATRVRVLRAARHPYAVETAAQLRLVVDTLAELRRGEA